MGREGGFVRASCGLSQVQTEFAFFVAFLVVLYSPFIYMLRAVLLAVNCQRQLFAGQVLLLRVRRGLGFCVPVVRAFGEQGAALAACARSDVQQGSRVCARSGNSNEHLCTCNRHLRRS